MLNVVSTQLCNDWISFPPVLHLSLLTFCLPTRARLIYIVMTREYACKAATLKCVNGLIFIHGIPGRVQTHKNADMKYLKIIYRFTYVALQMPENKNSRVTLYVIYGIHFLWLTEHLKNDLWPVTVNYGSTLISSHNVDDVIYSNKMKHWCSWSMDF